MKPCKKCGGTDLYKSGSCRQCLAAFYKDNAEKLRAKAIEYSHANKDSIKEKRKLYKDKNKDRIAKQRREYEQKNADRLRETKRLLKHKRRVLVSNSGVLSNGIINKLKQLQKNKCAFCRLPLGDKYHIDHIMPIALGGTNTDDNVQLLHVRCNLQKNKKHPIDFMQQHGFLL